MQNKRFKTHKILKERFLIGRNSTKRANFRGSPLFSNYVQQRNRKTNNSFNNNNNEQTKQQEQNDTENPKIWKGPRQVLLLSAMNGGSLASCTFSRHCTGLTESCCAAGENVEAIIVMTHLVPVCLFIYDRIILTEVG